jgi:hypothetical protein
MRVYFQKVRYFSVAAPTDFLTNNFRNSTIRPWQRFNDSMMGGHRAGESATLPHFGAAGALPARCRFTVFIFALGVLIGGSFC